MDFSIFSGEDTCFKYDEKIVKNKIKIIRFLSSKNPDDRKIEKLQCQIFKMCRTIVLKNINNYLKYTRNSSISDISFDRLDMESEAYIVFFNCIDKFDVRYKFYYYFNKALIRNFYRMFERQKQSQEKQNNHHEQYFHKFKNEYHQIDLQIDIYNFGLSDDDEIVLNSKLIGQTKDIFFELNPGFQVSVYNSSLKKIKTIVKTLIKTNEI